MTERLAIAKRTTHNIRARSPEIRSCIEAMPAARERMAKLLFTQELVKAELLPDSDVVAYERMARIADAQTRHHREIMAFFQTEIGYRICCIGYLADADSIDDIRTLLTNIDYLFGVQDIVDNAILLELLLGIQIKRASKYQDYNAAEHKQKCEKALIGYTKNIRAALIKCQRINQRETIESHLESLLAKHPPMSDSTHSAMLLFSSVKTCFELLNDEFFKAIANITEPVFRSNHELLIQAA